MRIYIIIFAVLLSITFLTGISCTKPAESTNITASQPTVVTPPAPPVTISVTPKNDRAGTKFDISCDNLKNGNGVKIKILQSDGTLVIDRAVASDNSSTFATSISTFGFEPGHYQCRLDDGDGKLLAMEEFDIAGTKKVLFEDDFSNGYSGWYVWSNDKDSFSYDNFKGEPVYHIKSNAAVWMDYIPMHTLGSIGNFAVEVDCWPDPTSTDTKCGLIFRYVSKSTENIWGNNVNFYGFGVATDPGMYGVMMWLDSKWNTLVKYTPTDATQKGQPNRLKVACNGSIIECYVNGLQVETFEDSRLASNGYVGLIAAGSKLNAYFDNFVVYQIK